MRWAEEPDWIKALHRLQERFGEDANFEEITDYLLTKVDELEEKVDRIEKILERSER